MFDALLALSQHLKLLVLGPLIVASLVIGAMTAHPPVFNSQAILVLPKPPSTEFSLLGSSASANAPTPAQAATVMKSAVILDAVFLALNPGSGGPDDGAREALAASIKTSATKEGLLKIDVTAATAAEAQKIAIVLIDAWLLTTRPAPQQQVELDRRLAHARQNLLTTQAILAAQKTSLLSMAGLGELLDRYFAQTLEIEREMNGLTRDVVVQLPTLASRPVRQAYPVVFLLVAFGVALLLVIWVLGRRAWKTAKEDPETAMKLEKLRGAARIDGA